METKVKAILFDCFGVLATDTWQAFLDSLPQTADAEEARQAHRDYDRGLLSKKDTAERIEAATGQRFTEIDDVADSSVIKNHKLLTYISELRAKGFKIGMLSNVATNWIRESFLTPREQQLFDDFILSYEVGMVKPQPQMFMLAAKRLGELPEQVLLVDDKPAYCQAAKQVGLKAVQYRNFHQFRDDLGKEIG